MQKKKKPTPKAAKPRKAKKVKKELEEAVRLNPSNIEAREDLEDFCITAPWIVGGNKDEAHDQGDHQAQWQGKHRVV